MSGEIVKVTMPGPQGPPGPLAAADPVLFRRGGPATMFDHDFPPNPILRPDKIWESGVIERTVGLRDINDEATIHLWYCASPLGAATVGYARTSLNYHYAAEVKYDSPVKDQGSGHASENVTPVIHYRVIASVPYQPTGTFVVLQYRSSATSSADCLSQAWSTYAFGVITLLRYCQFRVILRTLKPMLSAQVATIVVSRTGYSFNVDLSGGTFYGPVIFDAGANILRGVDSLRPMEPSKHWDGPAMGGLYLPGTPVSQPGGWRSNGISPGAILQKADGSFQMWPSGNSDTDGLWRIGYATSLDGAAWTIGNGDLPLDFWGTNTPETNTCFDPKMFLEDGTYKIYVPTDMQGTLYFESASPTGPWTPKKIVIPALNGVLPFAVAGRKVGTKYHFVWEELLLEHSGTANWHLVQAVSDKVGEVLVRDPEILVQGTHRAAHWREDGAATPWLMEIDDDRAILFVKGFVATGAIVCSGIMPESSQRTARDSGLIYLGSGCAEILLTSSGVYKGWTSDLWLPPGRCKGFLVELDEAQKDGVTGEVQLCVALGTQSVASGTISSGPNSASDLLIQSNPFVNVGGAYGNLASQYYSATFTGQGGVLDVLQKTSIFINLIGKAATVPGSGTRRLLVPWRVSVYVDQAL